MDIIQGMYVNNGSIYTPAGDWGIEVWNSSCKF